jgi:N-acyl-phosphatidylethanolamine-hydrolysing phospholipase D
MLERRMNRQPRDPDPRSFALRASEIVHPHAAPERLSATWVGHSTVLLQIGALNVLTDPIWSERASPVSFAGPKRWVPPGVPFEALPPIDIVLLSHNHYDHLDDRTVRRLAVAHPDATWAVPLGLAGFVRTRGVRQVVELDWWGHAAVGRARVVCAPAQHFSARGLRDRDATLWCGWALRVDRGAGAGPRGERERPWSIYFGGDTGFHPEFGSIAARLGPFNLTMLPVGAYDPRWFMRTVHMNPEEAVRAFDELNGGADGRSAFLPMHWGTFKLTDEAMDEPPARVRRCWKSAVGKELWLLAHGETRWWRESSETRNA